VVESTEEGIALDDTMSGVTVPHIRALAASFLRLLPVDGVSVGVRAGPDTAHLVHATNPVIAELDNIQLTLGEGPCVDAFRIGAPVLVPDLEHPTALQRWPGFAREATEAGAAAVFAFPLQIGAVPFGTVELYRDTAGALNGLDIATALLIADEMIRTVLEELAGPDEVRPTTADPDPLFGRAEIPQATGMIAVQLQVGMPEALAHLRAAAFTARRPVVDLARDVVARRIAFTNDSNCVSSNESPPGTPTDT
jgi:hypothetical protein